MGTQSKQSVSAAMVAAASKSAASASSASSPPPFVHAIAGSIGGAVATFLLYPLELIRVEMQSRGNGKEGVGKCRTLPPTSTNHAPSDNKDVPSLSGSDLQCLTSDNNDASSLPETNLQCFIRLYKEKSLYRGASSMVTTLMISNFILFYTLQVTRRILVNLRQGNSLHQQRGKISRLQNHIKFLRFILPKSNIGNSLLASSLAGVINVLLTTPLWVATRRIMESPSSFSDNQQDAQKQKQPNLWNVMHQISRKEGVLQLWNGTWSSLLLVSNPAIQYFLYEQVRLWLLERRKGQDRRNDRRHRRGGDAGSSRRTLSLTPMEAFVFGAMAKTVATVITYPLQLAQVLIRLRINELNESSSSSSNGNANSELETDDSKTKAYNGVTDCLYEQFTRGGMYSLFQGMNSKLLQTVLSAAFTFLTYEQTLVLVGRVYESSLAAR
mmetsp:Transcript_3153/g.6967  ORF Transcript_3153/g.6967 Transcript_3153/m.6967 type:complete len:440 (-) Transcript_3153:440-1759(-)